MLLGALLALACAALSVAIAAPYTGSAHDVDSPAKILLSLAGEDVDENDVVVDSAEEEDADFMPRDMRSNFLRYGRSSGGSVGLSGKTGSVKESGSRYSRGDHDDNFIRLGRSASFVRLGRNNGEEQKMPMTRSTNSNFIRLGRAGTEPHNFIRLGRGDHDFIRLGRGGEDVFDVSDVDNATLARLIRDSHFIRFGRAPNSNFVRLGRSDNYLRFGKSDNYLRFGRGSPDNFIRFGRAKNEPLFGRLKLNDRNFIRLGRSTPAIPRDGQITTEKYITFGKTVPETDDHATRVGRDTEHIDEKRTASSSRRKRTLLPEDEDFRYDDGEEKTSNADAQYQYYSPLAGVPFAPELTVLPPFYTKRANGAGNGNYIRFG